MGVGLDRAAWRWGVKENTGGIPNWTGAAFELRSWIFHIHRYIFQMGKVGRRGGDVLQPVNNEDYTGSAAIGHQFK